ncbi:outer membrane protein assembly factor BamE [Ruegeria sp. 2012CJ41-6]|uniref:Outer membrane protein assembly factor BamE n=1 Tax=Ruegeria spongiae TaxID=2942209 RepID=A0ABT0PZK2_9RHOB|nr:outer membrane protein assembly factor BamE [Ruegeria spongiae]MCL6283005.1 outer membrane protein assembly factor BamE [Ruegeria spongiae]
MSRIAMMGVFVLCLSACAEIYRNHGYVPPAEDLSKVTVGVDTRDSVIEAIGAPTASGVLEDSGYYYVQTRFRHYGARAPQIVSRELVAISFDRSGVVRNIERFGLEKGQVVTLQRRVTESSLEDKTFLRQLLGNLGNFDPGTLLPTEE